MGAGAGAFGMFLQAVGQHAQNENDERVAYNLQGRQQRNQKELNKYNQELAYDLWNKTNTEAQRKHIEDAGLSVGLMYGGSGAGGTAQTATQGGGASGGNITPRKSPMDGMGLAAQNLANVELTKAQTENVKADTENKIGVERENKTADTALKTSQEASNKIANELTQYGTVNGETPSKDSNAFRDQMLKDEEIIKRGWESNAARVNYEQMPDQLKIAWTKAAAEATQAEAALRNAKTNEQRIEYEKQLETKRQDLQKELYEMGLDQRKTEFITNSIFRGAEDIMEAAGRRATIHTQNEGNRIRETQVNDQSYWNSVRWDK